MNDARSRLEQSGITTTGADISVPLVAASYSHPLTPHRTITRLVREPLLKAEELTLGLGGLVPGTRTSVGHTRRRAIGFPAWPILTDPDNAQHALNLIVDLERAGHLARTKPAFAKDDIMVLADKLDQSAPHFLPTFLEEAGRFYLTAGNTVYASDMFSKARDAERRHGLPIDEDRHAEAIMEFALAGALNAKELTAEAKSLAERKPPAEAYETFRAFCLERVRGGLLPYSGMKRDLARLAKAAGLKPAEEEAALVPHLLRAGAIRQASAHFFRDYKKAICTAVADDETLLRRLISLTPGNMKIDAWLDLLRQAGALDYVKTGADPDFISRMIKWDRQQRQWWREPTQAETLPSVLAEILPHSGFTSFETEAEWLVGVSPDILETLLAHNVSLTLTGDRSRSDIGLRRWASNADRQPLPLLAANEDLRPIILGTVRGLEGQPEVLNVLATDPHMQPVVVEVLQGLVDKLEAATPTVDELVKVTKYFRDFESVDDADVQALLERVRAMHRDPAEIFAETLRRGLPDELGWLAFEQARRDLRPQHGFFHAKRTQDCWPGAIINDGRRAAHVRGETVTDIANWTRDDIAGGTEIDGHFALVSEDETTIWWADAAHGLPAEDADGWLAFLNATVPVPGGRLTGKGVIMRPGQPTWDRGSEQFFVDGDRVWLATQEETVEIDTATGETGRESLPDWFEEQRRRHPDLTFDPLRSQHRPVTEETADSLFSTAEGYHRHAVFTRPGEDFCLIVDADGTEYTVSGEYAREAHGVLQRPGGGTWILTRTPAAHCVLDPADLQHTRQYGLEFGTAMWWHHARVRQPEVSARFRTMTADDVRALVGEAAAAHANGVDKTVTDAVGEHLSVTDEYLREAVADHLCALVSSWPQSPALTEFTATPTLNKHNEPLATVTGISWDYFHHMNVWCAAAELQLHDRPLPDKYADWSIGPKTWLTLLGRGDALLALAATPGRTTEEVQALKELWVLLRDAGVLQASNLLVEERALTGYTLWSPPTLPPKVVLASYLGEKTTTIVRADGGGPLRVDGKDIALMSNSETPSPSRTDLEPVFDALLERIAADGPLPWSSGPGEQFAEASGVPLADAHLIMAGFPGFDSKKVQFLSKELRTAMGLKVAEATQARDRLSASFDHFLSVLAAGVPADAASLLVDGLDAAAMAQYWSEHARVDKEQLPADISERKPKHLSAAALERAFAGSHDEEDWANEATALLWLAYELDQSDPARTALADYADDLQHTTPGLNDVYLGYEFSTMGDNDFRLTLGLPERDPEDESVQTLTSGRFTIRQDRWDDDAYIDLSSVTDPQDPDLKQARGLAISNDTGMQPVAAYELRLRGCFGAYAEWLRQPGAGNPHDPLATKPELVADVAETLNVSQDAARYYLQLLALPDPTDANVRRWNNWKKADITAAGAELAHAKVVVEGKRSRAGRGFFLPGGWAEAKPPHLPIELWKVDAFDMVPAHYRTKYEPMLGVAVPPQWFTACWERSRGDDAPRFDELETTRRNR